MGLTREYVTDQLTAIHGALRSATIILENLYAALDEAQIKDSPAPQSQCEHSRAQVASGMRDETIRMFCPDCQKYLEAGVPVEDE